MEASPVPFHTFLLKVASRCNLDCTYCYVYNQDDDQWKNQPKRMSADVAAQTAERILEHCLAHDKKDVSIVFHGGEPMIGGEKHLRVLLEAITNSMRGHGMRINFGMQSNLLLFDRAIGDLLKQYRMTIGVSIDGPPKVNDKYRVDLRKKPTSSRLLQSIDLLRAEYPEIFSGFLTVIDVESDPIEVFDYLVSLGTQSVDFLYPLDNYDRRPVGKADLDATPYADWLIKIFDKWYYQNIPVKIRTFDSIMRTFFGGHSRVESVGLTPVDIVVVETNGEIEAVDSLKAAYNGATKLGYDVVNNTFDEVAMDINVKSRQVGVSSLCEQCQSCSLVDYCGGGYVPHRYSSTNQYDNPSVYCSDLVKLITHIYNAVSSSCQKVAANV